MLEIKSTVSTTVTPPLSHQAALVLPFPPALLQSLSTGGSQGSECPCADIELLGGNAVGWRRLVTKDCHPQVWTQSLSLVWIKEEWVVQCVPGVSCGMYNATCSAMAASPGGANTKCIL